MLKGEWPGRKRHHHPNDPNRSQGANSGNVDGIVTPAEHNYAGDEVSQKLLYKDSFFQQAKKKNQQNINSL